MESATGEEILVCIYICYKQLLNIDMLAEEGREGGRERESWRERERERRGGGKRERDEGDVRGGGD